MERKAVNQEVMDQFGRVFWKFRETVNAFPEDAWKTGESTYQRPAGLATHWVETVDFYTSRLTAEAFPWRERLGVDWEDPFDDNLPPQEAILAYLDELEAQVMKWAENADFTRADELHPYTGKTVLGRAIYLIRHCEAHLGELGLELHRRGLRAPSWR